MNRFFFIFQSIILLILLVLFLQGKGAHGTFLGIAIFIPVLRLVFSKSYRFKFKNFITQSLREFSEYHATLKTIPWKAGLALIFLPHVFFYLANGSNLSSFDNYGTLQSSVSLALEGNLELNEFVPAGSPLPYYLGFTKKGIRTVYPVGMVYPLAIEMFFSKWLGADLLEATVQWRIAKGLSAIFTGFSLVLFFLIALSFFSVEVSLFSTFSLGFGSAFFSTLSQGIWSHNGVVFSFLFISFLQLRSSLLKQKLNFPSLVGVGFFLQWMFLCRLTSVVILFPLLIWLFLENKKQFGVIILAAVTFISPSLFYFYSVYEHFLGPQMVQKTGFLESIHFFYNFFGLLVSPARGLLVYQPWVILLLVAIGLLYKKMPVQEFIRRKEYIPFFIVCVVASIFQLGLITTWPSWHGGESWGSRLLCDAIPALAIACLPAISFLWYKKRSFLYLLFIISFLMHLPAVYFFAGMWDSHHKIYPKGIVVDPVWDWSDPPFLYPIRRWLESKM